MRFPVLVDTVFLTGEPVQRALGQRTSLAELDVKFHD